MTNATKMSDDSDATSRHAIQSQTGRRQPTPVRQHSTATKHSKRWRSSDAILAEMVELFATECPKQMAEIAAAYASGDSRAVMRAAHTLKGSVSLFAARSSDRRSATHRIHGRDDKLDEFPEAWAELQRHIGELLQAVRRHVGNE